MYIFRRSAANNPHEITIAFSHSSHFRIENTREDNRESKIYFQKVIRSRRWALHPAKGQNLHQLNNLIASNWLNFFFSIMYYRSSQSQWIRYRIIFSRLQFWILIGISWFSIIFLPLLENNELSSKSDNINYICERLQRRTFAATKIQLKRLNSKLY